MNIKYGVVALVAFLIGLGLGFYNSRWEDMKNIADTCIAQQQPKNELLQIYKKATQSCLDPFAGKKGKK